MYADSLVSNLISVFLLADLILAECIRQISALSEPLRSGIATKITHVHSFAYHDYLNERKGILLTDFVFFSMFRHVMALQELY